MNTLLGENSTTPQHAESGLFDPSNMILIGVHGLVEKEIYEFLRKNRMKIITLDELSGKGFGPAVKKAMEELALTVESFYLSVDIDVVSAAFAPGVKHLGQAACCRRDTSIESLRDLDKEDVGCLNRPSARQSLIDYHPSFGGPAAFLKT